MIFTSPVVEPDMNSYLSKCWVHIPCNIYCTLYLEFGMYAVISSQTYQSSTREFLWTLKDGQILKISEVWPNVTLMLESPVTTWIHWRSSSTSEIFINTVTLVTPLYIVQGATGASGASGARAVSALHRVKGEHGTIL